MKLSWRCLFAALPIVMLAGCARVGINTNVAADGSFDRTVSYSISQMNPSGTAPKPEEAFALPANGNGVSVETKPVKDQLVTTVKRKVVAGGDPLKDLTLLSDKKQPLASSTVQVRKLDDGKLEYSETLHWIPAVTEADFVVPPELRAAVKSALPDKYKVTATIDKITQHVFEDVMHTMFGPSDPVFFSIMANPDLMERKLRQILIPIFRSDLKAEAPDLTDADADKIGKSMLDILKLDDMVQDKAKSAQAQGDDKKSDTNELTVLNFAVTVPGKVVQTNGLIDPITGEVYWSLYPLVLKGGDVVLKVVCQP